jgi:ABC-type Fe3+-hydroxamate transport system substrate-binding protein
MEGMDVPLEELREHLADDLRSRADRVDEGIDFLPFNEAGLEVLLGEAEFWDKHGADDELMRLDDEWNPALRRLRKQEMPSQEEVDAAAEKYRSRVTQLKKRAGPRTVSVADLAAVRGKADIITRTEDLADVLNVYKGADQALSALEKYVEEAVEEYDRAIQRQIDIERGK